MMHQRLSCDHKKSTEWTVDDSRFRRGIVGRVNGGGWGKCRHVAPGSPHIFRTMRNLSGARPVLAAFACARFVSVLAANVVTIGAQVFG